VWKRSLYGNGDFNEVDIMKAQLVSTKFSDLKRGDIVIGSCGHERTIAEIKHKDAGMCLVTFRGGGETWYRHESDTARHVIRG
jgi:hypothetical protein